MFGTGSNGKFVSYELQLDLNPPPVLICNGIVYKSLYIFSPFVSLSYIDRCILRYFRAVRRVQRCKENAFQNAVNTSFFAARKIIHMLLVE